MDSPKEARVEKMILDLGAEVYKLRHEINVLRGFRNNTRLVLKCIKSILKERGFVDEESFELALDVIILDESGSAPELSDEKSGMMRKLSN